MQTILAEMNNLSVMVVAGCCVGIGYIVGWIEGRNQR